MHEAFINRINRPRVSFQPKNVRAVMGEYNLPPDLLMTVDMLSGYALDKCGIANIFEGYAHYYAKTSEIESGVLGPIAPVVVPNDYQDYKSPLILSTYNLNLIHKDGLVTDLSFILVNGLKGGLVYSNHVRKESLPDPNTVGNRIYKKNSAINYYPIVSRTPYSGIISSDDKLKQLGIKIRDALQDNLIPFGNWDIIYPSSPWDREIVA